MSEAYATAVVVGRAPPVSSHLGDRAIVHADGRMEGFIGGSCSREIVRRQALEAIREGEPRLVRITPDDAGLDDPRDVVRVPMHCVSEGAVDVFIEPKLPKQTLLVVGLTPVAQALADIAPSLGFRVARFVDATELCDADGTTIDALADFVDAMDDYDRLRSAAVVASQGHYDERALTAILRHEFGYVGLLASRNRGADILEALADAGVSSERLQAVQYPAGIALGARKPAEIAVSIFAQMIEVRADHSNAESAEEAFVSAS